MAARTAHSTGVSAIPAALTAACEQVEAVLEAVLPRPTAYHARVQEAARYAIFAGGKRLRPFLTLQFADLFGAPADGAGCIFPNTGVQLSRSG